jgi:hypothetical protein
MDKWLKRVHISARDFEKAGRFVSCAMKHDVASLEHEAALLAAIICYGRPFSGNEIGDNPPADSRLTGVSPEDVLGTDLDLHNRIVRMRMKAVAHSESEYNPVDMALPSVGEPEMFGTVFASRTWHPVNECIDLDAFARMAEAMTRKCRNLQADAGRAAARARAAGSQVNP